MLMRIVRFDRVQYYYVELEETLERIEHAVMNIREWWLLLIVVLFLYILKGFLPIITIPALYLITGAMFPVYYALPINIAGLTLLISIKFYWGRKFGGGNAERILGLSDEVRDVFEHRKANPWILFAFRLIPSFPVNSVSRLYGSMDISYEKYLVISIIGFLPKVISYTFIGRNVYDPLSPSFLTPIVFVFLLSGLLILGVNNIMVLFDKKRGTLVK